jgi:hypothetical protein
MANRAGHGSPGSPLRSWCHACLLAAFVLALAAWPAVRAEPRSELVLRWPLEAGQDRMIAQGYAGVANPYGEQVVRQAGPTAAAEVSASQQEASVTPTTTALPTFSATPAPTATPLPPTATQTPLPSATPTQTPTATPHPSPTATSTTTPSPTPLPSPTPQATARPAATPTPTPARRLLGPLVGDEHAPLVLALAGLGLAGLAWWRLRDWGNWANRGD